MQAVRAHAHVVTRLPLDEIALIRRVRNGRVYYVAPGRPVATDETPGETAERVARDALGIDVEIEEMLYAQEFAGVENFFFLARGMPTSPAHDIAPPNELDDFEFATERGGTYELVRLRRRTLLAYEVRPRALAVRVTALGRNTRSQDGLKSLHDDPPAIERS